MYIVNHQLDRKFETFEEAVACAVENMPIAKPRKEKYWKVKKTEKGWSVTFIKPFHSGFGINTGLQFIQEI